MVCPLVWTTKEGVLRLLIIEHENVPAPILMSLRLSEGSKNGGWKKGEWKKVRQKGVITGLSTGMGNE